MQNEVNSNKAKHGLIILTIVTGSMFYFIITLIKDGYLKPGEYDFGKNVVLLVLSLVCLFASVFVWRKIYIQFKKDKTTLGFKTETSGILVSISSIVGAILTLISWLYFI